MATDILMPQLGESVTEGTIAKWLKKPGDPVAKYEPICEVSTDKVNAEVPSTYEGKMAEIIAEEGETVEVGQLICRIEVAGEEGGTEEPAKEEASAPAREEAKAPEQKPAAQKDDSNKHRYSPAVMRLAQENNIDLTQLTGTGKGGRITRKDVLKAIEEGTGRGPLLRLNRLPRTGSEKAAEPKPKQTPAAETGLRFRNGTGKWDTEIPVTSVRRTIANRMVQSKHEAPHAWTMMEVDVTGLVELRNRLKHDFQKREGVKLTFMPFFIKAVVDSLKEYPILNSVWADDKIISEEAH